MATIEKRTSSNNEVSYRVKVRMLGHKAESATFASLTRAKRWAQDTESAMRDGRHFKTVEAKKHSIGTMIDRYCKDVLPTKRNPDHTKAQLLWWKAQIGERVLSDVSSALIVEYRDRMLAEPVKSTKKVKQTDGTVKEIITEKRRSPATVVRYLAALSTVFGLAVTEWKWITRDQNPMPDVKKPKEARGRVRYLSDDERERLLLATKASANTYLYPITVIALSTGMRLGEIMNLTWDDVDFQNKRIIIHETKNGERRAAPLAGRAFDELTAMDKVKRTDTKLIFASKKTTVIKINDEKVKVVKPILITKAWLTAIDKAGIDNFHFHDLRHSCASYLAMNGASLAEIAEVLGHKTLQMVKRYAHLSEQHTLGVVERMNKKIFG